MSLMLCSAKYDGRRLREQAGAVPKHEEAANPSGTFMHVTGMLASHAGGLPPTASIMPHARAKIEPPPRGALLCIVGLSPRSMPDLNTPYSVLLTMTCPSDRTPAGKTHNLALR